MKDIPICVCPWVEQYIIYYILYNPGGNGISIYIFTFWLWNIVEVRMLKLHHTKLFVMAQRTKTSSLYMQHFGLHESCQMKITGEQ